MDPNFWHARWESNQIGFHQPKANAMLVRHLDALGLAGGARIFLPLCGKTLDIGWLLSRGLRVAGAELSEIAVRQLFDDLGVTPRVSTLGALTLYRADGIDIFVGDMFDLTADALGPVDAVYDRAALVALPQEMRPRYAAHLAAITQKAPQFLITFEYDQSVMDGPPFSVVADEVERLYGRTYDLTSQDKAPVEGGLKGICPADETVWLLR